MNLLQLDPRISLEFARRQLPIIVQRLRRHGRVSRKEQATFNIRSVADEQFILMDDWAEPALISMSPAGDAILRDVATGRRRRVLAHERRASFRDQALAEVLAA